MKRPSLIFRIQRFIYFLFQGIGRREVEHYLFTLEEKMTDVELYMTLSWHGFQPNYFGYIYKGQIYQCRRMVHGGKHQYHVRCYDTGKITGHLEITPEYDEQQHLAGQDLRTMNRYEAERLKNQLEGTERLARWGRRGGRP